MPNATRFNEKTSIDFKPNLLIANLYHRTTITQLIKQSYFRSLRNARSSYGPDNHLTRRTCRLPAANQLRNRRRQPSPLKRIEADAKWLSFGNVYILIHIFQISQVRY